MTANKFMIVKSDLQNDHYWQNMFYKHKNSVTLWGLWTKQEQSWNMEKLRGAQICRGRFLQRDGDSVVKY